MTRYSYGLKKKIIEKYLCGRTSCQTLVIGYQTEKSVLRLWISDYKNYGDEGLTRSRNNRVHSVEFKLEAITCYETSECNYRQLALELGLTNSSMTVDWRGQYREEDIEGLLPYKRGRSVTKKNDHNQSPEAVKKSESIDAPIREALENHIKELKAENRKLTIQKMFWEQLRSLEKEEAMNRR